MATVLTVTATACSTTDNIVIESENQDTRVRMVVIHHTSSDFQDSLNVLTKDSSRPVSSHYLVPEPGDPSYTGKDLKIYKLVNEEGRAWHAGSSYWDGKTSLNDMSVGIELVNRTYCHTQQASNNPEKAGENPARICFYPDFAETQLALLIDLLDGILQRHTEVKPTHIVGHSDIAPQRKIDPGPRFPWQRLYQLGYGAWYDDETVIRYWEQFQNEMPSVLTLQTALNTYGYGIELSGEHDQQSRNVVRAFQLHFLPWQVTSEFNPETVAALYALIEKYHEPELEALLGNDMSGAGIAQ
jgi:N-acetylmuramoyl-L-alanine amidase